MIRVLGDYKRRNIAKKRTENFVFGNSKLVDFNAPKDKKDCMPYVLWDTTRRVLVPVPVPSFAIMPQCTKT